MGGNILRRVEFYRVSNAQINIAASRCRFSRRKMGGVVNLAATRRQYNLESHYVRVFECKCIRRDLHAAAKRAPIGIKVSSIDGASANR